MRFGFRVPAMATWLIILWIALWGGISWANVLSGLVVASAVGVVARTGWGSFRRGTFRPHWALWYALVVLGKLIQSNLHLAWEIITPKMHTHTAIIAVPMRGGSDAVVNLVANSITLTPGTMTVDVVTHDVASVDGELPVPPPGDGVPARVTLYVHGIFASDPERVRHDVLELEAVALRAFGSAEDYLLAERDVVEHLPSLDHPVGHRAEARARRRATRGRDRGGLGELQRAAGDPESVADQTVADQTVADQTVADRVEPNEEDRP